MQPWIQNYDPLASLTSAVPQYLLSSLVAAIPLIVFFYLLAVKRKPGHKAAFVGTSLTFLLAVLVWDMPVSLAASATLMGACFGLFPIIWIVVTAVWLYNMTVESGEFEIIKDSLASLTDDRRLQAIFIAFAFGAFLEGTAGFGTPVAITTPMLVGLGFNPLYAAGICLIANTAPVAFGAIGVPVVVAADVAKLDLMAVTQVVGRQLSLLAVFVPLWLCVTMCGPRKSLEVLPAILVAGLCYGLTQFLVADFHGPYLPVILASAATLAGLVVLLRFWKPRASWRFPGEPPATSGGATVAHTGRQILRAWSPYLVLAVLVFVWGLQGFKNLASSTVMLIDWPGLHGLVMKTAPITAADVPYAARFTFNLITSGGTAILLAGLIGCCIIPDYGPVKALRCLARTCHQLRFPICTVVMILALAYIMNYSGMSSTLGLACTKTGGFFPFFSPILGWIGVFLTGSDSSSNALFCGLQRTTAEAVGVNPYLTVGANSSGGAIAKMISPQSISVATASAGLADKEGVLFRLTFWHAVAMGLLMAILTLLQAYWLEWTVPAYVPPGV